MRAFARAVFLLLCAMLGGSSVAADAGGAWMEASPTMDMRRSQHTATLLPDGRILLVGGFEHTSDGSKHAASTSCEIYDPARGTKTRVKKLNQGRSGHTATLLTDGRVLVTGGFPNAYSLPSAEIYDPSKNEWKEAQPMKFARGSHTATLLQDGKVLVAGGIGIGFPNVAELYDPKTDTWSEAGVMAGTRAFHTATLLKNGRILIMGGMRYGTVRAPGDVEIRVQWRADFDTTVYGQALQSIEVFDPNSTTWTSLGSSLIHGRGAHSATMLPDGKVLITGGVVRSANLEPVVLNVDDMKVSGMEALGSSELFDPDTLTLSEQGCLPRAFHTATLLPDGKLMVAGGYRGNEPLQSVEVYDQTTGRWSPAANLLTARVLHTATLLPGGRVFVAGGLDSNAKGLASADLYEPASGDWSLTGSERPPRRLATATWLPHEGSEGILVVGGRDGSRPLDSTELYPLSALSSAPVSNSMDEARDSHSATLLPDGKLLVIGGRGDDAPILDSVKLHDHSAQTWAALPSLSEARFSHTATLLADGRVLVAGGTGTSAPLRSAELYDPKKNSWSSSTMLQEHSGHTATLLADGRVLIAGGKNDAGPENCAEMYDPRRNQWQTQPRMGQAREFHTATLLPDGKVLVTGGEGSTVLGSAELFDPVSKSWTETGSMSTRRSGHTATLLPAGMVLVTGGYGMDGQPLSSAEVYEPATGQWSPMPAMKQARAEHSVVLLPDGRLFVVGGTAEASAELYTGPGVNTAGGPHIAEVKSGDWQPGSDFTLQGSPLWVRSEAGGGDTRASAADFPLLTLRSLENGRWISLAGRTSRDVTSGADILTATLPALPSGQYVLTVTSRGLSSGKGIHIQNTTHPDTFLSSWPSQRTAEKTASFTFGSSAVDLPSPEDAFECALDSAGFSPCSFASSSLTVSWSNLEDGAHTFQVRARDIAGNVDDEPARYSWSVDTQAPVTTITSAPPTRTSSTSAAFSFSTEAEDWERFECSLDEEDAQPCSSPFSREGLDGRRHTLKVWAVDDLGNREDPPAEHTWIVQRSHYGMSCTASSGMAWTGWAGSLVLMGLLRRRRRQPGGSACAE